MTPGRIREMVSKYLLDIPSVTALAGGKPD